MLSIFEILIFTTTSKAVYDSLRLLWFAFNLWDTDIYNNWMMHTQLVKPVVICFQSLRYWYLQQQISAKFMSSSRCDLLSIFEILIFTTTGASGLFGVVALWFAFNLWDTDIYNNEWLLENYPAQLWFAFNLWDTDIYNNRYR